MNCRKEKLVQMKRPREKIVNKAGFVKDLELEEEESPTREAMDTISQQ